MNNKILSISGNFFLSPVAGKKLRSDKKSFLRTVLFLLFVPVLFFGAGCKSKKAITVAPIPPEMIKPSNTSLLIRKMNSNENTFSYYSVKGEASFKDQSTEQSFDVSIVMEKDNYIWMNITALFGIEIARIKFTPDSIIILDRMHKKCIISDYDYIKKISNIDLKLKQLQQIIIGNPAFDIDEHQSIVDTLLQSIVIYTIRNTQKQTAFYNSTLKLSKNILEETNLKRQFIVEYSNPYIYGNNAYPSTMTINIRAEKNMECTFRLSNFVFEKKKESLFSIPGNYEIIKQ